MDNNQKIDVHNPSVVRKLGIAALTKELGVVGMIYFMRQFDNGNGDYTTERDELFSDVSMDEVLESVCKIENEKNKI